MAYNAKILFLDDQENRYKLLRRIAPNLKWAKNTRDFQKLLHSQQFDILMLDHDLGPGDSGMNAVFQIKQLKPDVKQIIVHSGNIIAGPKMVKYLKEMGYNAEYVIFFNLIDILKETYEDAEYVDCKVMWE